MSVRVRPCLLAVATSPDQRFLVLLRLRLKLFRADATYRCLLTMRRLCRLICGFPSPPYLALHRAAGREGQVALRSRQPHVFVRILRACESLTTRKLVDPVVSKLCQRQREWTQGGKHIANHIQCKGARGDYRNNTIGRIRVPKHLFLAIILALFRST